MHSIILADGEESQEISNEDSHQDVTLCKQCGKQIQAVALYCSYCGANQSITSTTLRKKLQKLKDLSFLNALVKKFVGFILILMLLYLIGGIIATVCQKIGGSYDVQGVCLFAPLAAYVLYRLLHYAYKFNHKKSILTRITLASVVFIVWGVCIADSIRHDAYVRAEEASERAEAQRIEEMHRVNRTFLGCSFGDNASKVANNLKKYVPNNLHPATRFSGSVVDKIWLENISYGDYTLNTISFLFYRDKLYKVVMNIHTAENESYSDLWTYNNLSTILSEKYKINRSARPYNNMEIYYDAHTEVRLWHSTYGMGKYEVTLTYYDKDSGYKEHQEKGF